MNNANPRLIIVSNRLPYIYTERAGRPRIERSTGGLVTGITSFLDNPPYPISFLEYLWFGWPGTVSIHNKDFVTSTLAAENCKPVFIDTSIIDGAYLGFSNQTLWPLFHQMPSKTKYSESWWLSYIAYNKIFSEEVGNSIQGDDVVWIHDYHLLLLPSLLRHRYPCIRIGFFLHIPFPLPSFLELLPVEWRFELLTGLLGANLIGFHTDEYQANFLQTIENTGIKAEREVIQFAERQITSKAFPLGIDFAKYFDASHSQAVKKAVSIIKDQVQNKKIILSVSRLDYTKGIVEALHGYEQFLSLNVNWHEQVVFLLMVVPSRMDVLDNQILEHQVSALVGHINGKFGNLNWQPISYQIRLHDFQEMVTLYKASNIAFVNSLMDGMNLISKEYIASQSDHDGVIILSKMTGSARELPEAILINPYDPNEISHAIKAALEMSLDEQQRRIKSLQNRLRERDILSWGRCFIDQLRKTVDNIQP